MLWCWKRQAWRRLPAHHDCLLLSIFSLAALPAPNTSSMATSQPRKSSRTVQPLPATVVAYRTDAAVENRASGFTRGEKRAAATLGSFTFCKTYLDTNVTLLGDQQEFEPDVDGYTCLPGAAAAYDASIDDTQPQARGHTAAYKLAVQLANRSNGAPLATIIEQGSYSTLNSYGSLLSVGRFPSIKAAENTSPNRGSRRRSCNLDEKALHDIQEDLARDHDAPSVAVRHTRLNEDCGGADPASGTATPLTSYRFELHQSPSSQSGDELLGQDSRGVKEIIRGVMRNVRGVSRTRSRSSSMTQAPIMEHRESPPSTCESSPHIEQQHDQRSEVTHVLGSISNIQAPVSDTAAIPPTPRDQTQNCAKPSVARPSARVHRSSSHSRSELAESTSILGSIPVLPNRAATRSHERPFSISVVRSRTRDVASEGGTAQASTTHHDTFDTLARYTLDGLPSNCRQPSSMREASSARQVSIDQNASFCSTVTSSYSGTVLGVDLDLQHDFTHPIRRSQSPPTPVWFTPQMAELERQASFSESPESIRTIMPPYAPSHSVTSSALTSLLPIAAASGIVRPNFDTPKISFYSPSGNLIQPESSSPQGTSPSEYGGSPTITTSYYNRHTNAASSSGSLSIRPPLVPMTTPPTHKAPLPPHLRHHHNYRHPEMSQISSGEPSITPSGPVKGCDGIVRENSVTPCSGVFHPNGKDKIHRSTRLTMHDLKAEAKFYKARFFAQAAAQSFIPSIHKGRTLQKRHVHNYNTYARKSHVNNVSAHKGAHRGDVLAPFAAHALRVCFCQPYDDAERPTRGTAASTCLAGGLFSESARAHADQGAKDAERSLPNARVVGSGGRSEGGDTRRATRRGTRRDSTVGSTTRRKLNSGMARRKVD